MTRPRICLRHHLPERSQPMNSSPSSTPSGAPLPQPSVPLPNRTVLADMLVYYATPQVRERIMTMWPEDADLLDRLIEEVHLLAATWEPTVEWHHRKLAEPSRRLEWMVWQVVTSHDPDMGAIYEHEAIVPWAIDIETLPRYGEGPTVLVPDDSLLGE